MCDMIIAQIELTPPISNLVSNIPIDFISRPPKISMLSHNS